MSIPSQFPQIVAAARGTALQALALQAGQSIEGKVIGPAPNGGTQVQIAGQSLNLVLPLATKAGDVLKFDVQGSGAQLRLAIQAATIKALSTPGSTPATSTATARPTVPLVLPNAGPPTAPGAASAPTTSAATQLAPQPTFAQPAAQSAVPAGTAQSAQAVTTQPQPVSSPPPPTPADPAPAAPQQAQTSTPAGTTAPTQPPAAPAPAAIAQYAAPPGQAAPQAVPNAPNTAPPPPAAPQSVPTAAPPQVSPTANAPGAKPAGPQPGPAGAPATTPAAQALRPPAYPTSPPLAATAATGQAAAASQVTAASQAATAQTPALPQTPQAALAQMVQSALPRQNSIVSLTAALTAVAGKVALPEPVIKAAQQVLAGRVVLDGGKFDGAALQKAVQGSGIFQEANLAADATRLPTPQTDMKSALLGLRQTLASWLGQQAALAAVAQPAPPLRGQVPRAKGPLPPPVDPAGGSEAVGKQLLERTDAALSRLRLHQHASLPEPAARNADWSMDLPVVIAGQQTMMQLQIHRDEHSPGEEKAERGWQMRFAVNVPDMGEVGAQVSLRGRTTGVMLWAADSDSATALESEIQGLRDMLASVGLQPGAVIVRHGAPTPPAPSPSGHFVDARS